MRRPLGVLVVVAAVLVGTACSDNSQLVVVGADTGPPAETDASTSVVEPTTTEPAPTTTTEPPATTAPPVTTEPTATTEASTPIDASRLEVRPVLARLTGGPSPDWVQYVTAPELILPESPIVLLSEDGSTLYQLGPAGLSGRFLDSVGAEIDPMTGGWHISITLASGADGLDRWNDMAAPCNARDDTCADGGMALVLGDRVLSAPVPQIAYFSSPEVSITWSGDFTEQEARHLARLLTSSAVRFP